MPDAHLSHMELTRWRDEGAGDRARIVGHLAACAPCRALAAEIERHRPAEALPVHLDAADFVERGYQAGTAPARAPGAGRWMWVAAAAAIVTLALVPMWLARVEDDPGAMRGDTSPLAPVSPVDVTVPAADLRFEWRGAAADDRVRLNVISLDRPGEPIIEREVIGSGYEPTAEERQRFRPGQTVHWYVESRGGAGGGPSPAARFRVR